MKITTAKRLARLITVIGILAVSATNASPVSIRWEIGNRFRNFDFLKHDPGEISFDSRRAIDQKNSGLVATKWFEAATSDSPNQGSKDPRDQIAWMDHIAETLGSPYVEGDNGAWDEASGSYDKDLVKLPQFMTIRASLVHNGLLPEALKGQICRWKFNGEDLFGKNPPKPFHCDENTSSLLEHIPTSGGTLGVYSGNEVLAETQILAPPLKIILGFGDSYSAGEGTPDHPTLWREGLVHAQPEGNVGRVWDFDKHLARGAYWHSNRCDRSFYSWETQVALLIAKRDPHSIVSFVHLACAGAEVIDGMLFAQRNAPGQYRDCQPAQKRKGHGLSVDFHCDVPSSQLAAAVKLLCVSATSKLRPQDPPLKQWIEKLRSPEILYAKDQLSRDSDLVQCQGEVRRTYLVLMNMGGNDLGFAGLIANIVFPSGHRYWLGKLAVAFGRKSANAVCFNGSPCPDAGDALTFEQRSMDLPTRYDVLQEAFQSLLKIDASQVVIAQYPNPLTNSNGSMCNDPGNEPNDRKDNQWTALKWFMPHYLPSPLKQIMFWDWTHRYEFNITKDEGAAAGKNVIPKLNRLISEKTPGWIVARTSDAFLGHGWCVGKWNKLFPDVYASSWDAFGMNGRYIRTADDSALTQWPPHSGSNSKDRLDGLSGTLHHNLQGYAAIAYGVMNALVSYQRSTQQAQPGAPTEQRPSQTH